MRNTLLPRTGLAPLTALALLGAALTAAPAAAVPTPRVSYPELQKQIAAHQVRHATINRKAHDVKVTLTDGKRELVIYPSREEPALAAQLTQSGATVTVKKKKKKVKASGHRLRYIGAALILAVVLIGGAVYVAGRRRQRAPAPGATGSPPAGTPPPPHGDEPPPGPAPGV